MSGITDPAGKVPNTTDSEPRGADRDRIAASNSNTAATANSSNTESPRMRRIGNRHIPALARRVDRRREVKPSSRLPRMKVSLDCSSIRCSGSPPTQFHKLPAEPVNQI